MENRKQNCEVTWPNVNSSYVNSKRMGSFFLIPFPIFIFQFCYCDWCAPTQACAHTCTHAHAHAFVQTHTHTAVLCRLKTVVEMRK